MKPIKTEKLKTTSAYGKRKDPISGKDSFHYGIDLVGGQDIIATADGQVIKVVNKGSKGGTMCLVRIQHKTYQSAYYHVKSGSVVVKVGDWVKAGQKVATIGTTGKSTGVHLHFQIDKGTNATAIDPTDYAYGKKELAGKTKPAPAPTPSKLPTTHTVKKGDTMSAICKKYYGTYTVALGNKIVAANKKKYPKISLNYIVVGWKLTIPAK